MKSVFSRHHQWHATAAAPPIHRMTRPPAKAASTTLVVIVRPDVAHAVVRTRSGGRATSNMPADLAAVGRSENVTFEPLHMGTADPTLARYWRADLPDAMAAEEIAVALRRSCDVEAAYLTATECARAPRKE
jgi:hypothetical protein